MKIKLLQELNPSQRALKAIDDKYEKKNNSIYNYSHDNNPISNVSCLFYCVHLYMFELCE